MDTTCPYCNRPEGWDACPVHRDGIPTPTTHPTPGTPTEERRPDPRTTEQRHQ
jgi:hypothetical protein